MSSLASDAFVLSLHKVPEFIRVELSDQAADYFLLPVIPAQLRFESFASTDPLLSLQKIIEWVRTEFAANITETQAWDLLVAVRAAFELHKKKLDASLISLTGSTESTPSEPPPQT